MVGTLCVDVICGNLRAVARDNNNFLKGNTMNKAMKLAVAAALLGCATGAMAQAMSYYPSWYVMPSVNLIKPDSIFGTDNRGEGAGLKFGRVLSPTWDMQMGFTYARARGNNTRYQQDTLGVDALYMFSRDRFRPFLLAGIGAEYDKSNDARGETTKTSPYLSAGAGFQYAFTDQLSMQADVRRVHGFLRDSAFNSRSGSNNYLTVGLNYYFDKPTPAPMVAAAPMPVAQPMPAPAPAPRPAPPAPRFEKTTMSATELFGFDRSDIRAPHPKLDEIAAALSANPGINNIVITGYTDRIGTDKYNQKLSERRANAVKVYLVNKGIAASRLSAVGKGEANPIVMCSQKQMAALIKCLEPNRRVEVEQITIERQVQ